MKIPARSSILLVLLALGLGCAAKSKAPGSAHDAYQDAYAGHDASGGEAMADAMAGPVPASAMPASMDAIPSAAAAMPAGVMGSVPASRPSGSETAIATSGQPAIADDLPTRGEDSIEQMLVFTGAVGLAVQPDSIPASIDAAVDLAVRAGGYIAQQTDTSLTLRVPSRRFRGLMKGIEGLGQVRSRSVQTLDVSERFHDLQVRLENLEATRGRIQKLLGQAGSLSEILVVEKELERVSAEIDEIKGQLRFLSSQAAFSTVTIAFSELPRELTIVEEEREELPPPPPPPARVLETSVEWIDEVDVNRLLSLR